MGTNELLRIWIPLHGAPRGKTAAFFLFCFVSKVGGVVFGVKGWRNCWNFRDCGGHGMTWWSSCLSGPKNQLKRESITPCMAGLGDHLVELVLVSKLEKFWSRLWRADKLAIVSQQGEFLRSSLGEEVIGTILLTRISGGLNPKAFFGSQFRARKMSNKIIGVWGMTVWLCLFQPTVTVNYQFNICET